MSGFHYRITYFLIYVNDTPKKAVKSNLLLHVDDQCLIYQHKDTVDILKKLNEDFENICQWVVEKTLSIYFDEDKPK